jgi:hypothetical protein
MREEEGDADRRLSRRREPLVRQKELRPQQEALVLQLAAELAGARLEIRSADAHAEVADTEVEQVVVRELLPGDLPSDAAQGRLLPRSAGAASRGC